MPEVHSLLIFSADSSSVTIVLCARMLRDVGKTCIDVELPSTGHPGSRSSQGSCRLYVLPTIFHFLFFTPIFTALPSSRIRALDDGLEKSVKASSVLVPVKIRRHQVTAHHRKIAVWGITRYHIVFSALRRIPCLPKFES